MCDFVHLKTKPKLLFFFLLLFLFSPESPQPDMCLTSLQYSITVAQELLRLAKSRQGPLLLLSSSYSLVS